MIPSTPLIESLEARALLAGDTNDLVCPVSSAEVFFSGSYIPDQSICPKNAESEALLQPSGTSRIDHYPESKGWIGDLWDYALTMFGWH
jgi:hypothetical protein